MATCLVWDPACLLHTQIARGTYGLDACPAGSDTLLTVKMASEQVDWESGQYQSTVRLSDEWIHPYLIIKKTVADFHPNSPVVAAPIASAQ